MKYKQGRPTISQERFSAALKAKGWTMADLVRASGVDRAVIHRIKWGQTDASFSTVIAVADALEVSLDYLACRDEFIIS